MNTFLYIVVFSIIGSIVSLIGGILLLSNQKSAHKLALYATPFAGGALLAAVFVDLLPEGIAYESASTVLVATMIGMIIFFLAEGGLRWFHHHHEHEHNHGRQSSPGLIVVGDTVHNALDGVAIAASFMISIPTGVVTTLAVAAHEIPQEIGDFGLLLAKGYSRKKVLFANLLSAFATLVGAVLTYVLGSSDALPVGTLLGLSAGFLLYISASDVIPTIHESKGSENPFFKQALLFLGGVVLVSVSTVLAHNIASV